MFVVVANKPVKHVVCGVEPVGVLEIPGLP